MLTIRIGHAGVYPSTIKAAITNKWKGYENRTDWGTFAVASNRAEQLTTTTDELYIPIDCGNGVSPRYDVIKAPKIGDDVSYSLNGDTYPCGQIAKISESLRRIETNSGRVFWRRKLSSSWIDGCWFLVQGHIFEQNPSF